MIAVDTIPTVVPRPLLQLVQAIAVLAVLFDVGSSVADLPLRHLLWELQQGTSSMQLVSPAEGVAALLSDLGGAP